MKQGKYHKWRVFDISMAHFVHDVYSSFLAPLLPLLIEKIGLNYFLAGSLTLYGRIPSLMNPFIGWMADKVVIRYFVIITPAITAIAMSFIGMANTYSQLLFLLLIMGFSSAFFSCASTGIIENVSGDKTGKGMSNFMVAGEMARAAGPLLIISAVSWWGLEGSWRVMPLGLLASIIIFFRLKKLKDFDIKPKKSKIKISKDVKKKLAVFFAIVSGFILGRGILRAILITFLPTYYASMGNDIWTGTTILILIEVAGAIGTLIAGRYSDKIGRKKVLVFIALIMPVLMFFYNFTSGIVSIIFLIISGLFLFGASPVLLALVHDFKSDRPSFFNSIYMTINFIFTAGATMLVGYLSDIFSLETIFYYSPLLALTTVPFAFMMPEFKKKG